MSQGHILWVINIRSHKDASTSDSDGISGFLGVKGMKGLNNIQITENTDEDKILQSYCTYIGIEHINVRR
jgi:hypothetical protein